MTILLRSAALIACLAVMLSTGSGLLAAAVTLAAQNPAPTTKHHAKSGLTEAAAPRFDPGGIGLQLAQTKSGKKKSRKRSLKTVTKKKRCGVQLGPKLKDLPFPAFIRKLAAVKTVRAKTVRGRKRRVVKVLLSAQKARERFAKIWRRADKINDSRMSNKQKLNAINTFVALYAAGIKAFRRFGFVDKPSRTVGGGHKTMSESLKVLRAWQREYQAIVAASAKGAQTPCQKPKKAKTASNKPASKGQKQSKSGAPKAGPDHATKPKKKCKGGGLVGNTNCVTERMGQ